MADVTLVMQEAGLDRVLDFGRRWGRGHLLLAAHAADAPVLTADLLYAIRDRFVADIAPWVAVSDVLLLLCRQVGFELYEFQPAERVALRDYLARDLRYGPARLAELNTFQQDYSARHGLVPP